MIGVFDSGLGGLTVLKYFLRDLGEYDYMYFGDSIRAPYGSKSQELIYNYTREAVDFLFSRKCDLIIIACNTASSQALRKIQQEYLPKKYPNKRILGVVRPLAEMATSDENNRVGVLATKATVESDVYKKEINKLNPDVEVFQNSAPLLVPLIEENWIKRPETKKILKKYLRPLKEKKVQALILACTHYPFLLKDIRRIMGKNCKVYNPGKIIAKSLADYIERHEELGIKKSKNKIRKYYTTDDPDKFRQAGERFLGEKMMSVGKVTL